MKKRFSEIKEIKNKTIHAVCQKKGWCDTQTFIKWYEKVYLKYEKFTVKEKCLLILDKSSSHNSPIITDLFKKNDTYHIFIPDGLTLYLQPLDIGINKPFKAAIKRHYLLNKINSIELNSQNNFTQVEKRKKIIENINKIWWDDNEIKTDSIINSFHKASTSLKSDGIEEESWEFPEQFKDDDNIYEQFEKI